MRDLATVDARPDIFDSWVDATHDAVFYALGQESGIEFHRVAIDGSDDRVVATVAPEPTGFTAELALDDSVFVVDSCHAGSGCPRTVVDAATGASERTERAGDPVCAIFGIVDGTIVGSRRPVCTEDAPTDVVAVSLAGGSSTVLVADCRASTLEGASVVDPTRAGIRPGRPGRIGRERRDGLGRSRSHDPVDLPDRRRRVGRVAAVARRRPPARRLDPVDRGGLGDFPWQRAIDRPVPVLVNLVTDERIELVNLPHWTGNFST